MVTAISAGADAAGAAAGADTRPPAPLPPSAAGSSGRLCIESELPAARGPSARIGGRRREVCVRGNGEGQLRRERGPK